MGEFLVATAAALPAVHTARAAGPTMSRWCGQLSTDNGRNRKWEEDPQGGGDCAGVGVERKAQELLWAGERAWALSAQSPLSETGPASAPSLGPVTHSKIILVSREFPGREDAGQ